jgi:tetratricopeptide (TPR) repeat protein
MGRIEKTVFISYRRTNIPWALAIFQNLTHHGYDVFFDFSGIASGDFERVILGNITSRAHFLALLTPSALERCDEPGDWLRREIEIALEARRNIVPLMLEGFEFSTPSIGNKLTGKLADLKRYQALRIPADFFMEAMDRLRGTYLSVPLDGVIHPAPPAARQEAKHQRVVAESASPVQLRELTAQEWFEQGYKAVTFDEKMRCYTEAIRLKPDFAEAFNNRGNARRANADLNGAIRDFDEAIRLKPDYSEAFNNRGGTRKDNADLNGAIRDYDEAIRLKPDYSEAFNNRGAARIQKGDLNGAIRDYNEATRLKPDNAIAFNNRGTARYDKGDLNGAIRDYDEAIRVKPDYAAAFFNRGSARSNKGDLNGAIRD